MNGQVTRSSELLRIVHDHPGITRVDATRTLGVSTGAATDLVAKLTAAGLIAEAPAAPSGIRGRPTTVLGPHPNGPLVLAASITQVGWQIEAAQLGGEVVAAGRGEHDGHDPKAVVSAVAKAGAGLRRRFPGRIKGLGVAAPGTVADGVLLHASGLGWFDVDLRPAWRTADVFVAGNDATFAASAESHRGAASGFSVALHLRIDAGLGGAVVDHGRVFMGVKGLAGEFGHMPFGDPSVPCPCGAFGCWGPAVDGTALARLLSDVAPRDSVGYARDVIGRAAAGEKEASEAVGTVATALGRGIAGLVNGLDPDIVTLGGVGAELLATDPDALRSAYRAGLMSFRWAQPPPVLATQLSQRGTLAGASEEVWARLWPHLPT